MCRLLLALLLLLGALPAAALNLEYVAVRNAGNAPDDTGYGAVSDNFAIAKYEIKNAQYVEFLNAVANETDVFGLFNPSMPGIVFPIVPVGFERFYEVVPGFASKPVDHVSVYDAFRFANWLHNGQLSGAPGIASTEDGAYTMITMRRAIVRAPGAEVFVPSVDEWYKAAYYDPAANSGAGGYFEYPAGTDAPTICAVPSAAANTANCESAANGLTDVGAYPDSASPYGTFDQGGNTWEWTEDMVAADVREIRGGSWFTVASALGAASTSSIDAETENIAFGFRVARTVPEPGRVLLALTGALVLAAVRRRA